MYSITLGQTLNQAKQYNEAYSTLKAVRLQQASRPTIGRPTRCSSPRPPTRSDRAGEAVNVLNAQTRADSINAASIQALGVAQDDLGRRQGYFRGFKRAFELDSKDRDQPAVTRSAPPSSRQDGVAVRQDPLLHRRRASRRDAREPQVRISNTTSSRVRPGSAPKSTPRP